MAKVDANSVTISKPVYPKKVLQDLVTYGYFYISNVEGHGAVGTETEGNIFVYGIVNSDHTLVQGFLVDSGSLVLPCYCLTTWVAGVVVWKRVDIDEYMQENPNSSMDERFNQFLEWLGKAIETPILKGKIK